MRFPIAIALATAALSAQTGDSGQAFMLQGNDYKWMAVTVRRVPTAIDCHFDVVGGRRTVHVELVSVHDFLLFSRGRDYERLAMTSSSGSAGFHAMIETPGRYRIVIVNDRGALPVAAMLTTRMEVDPEPSTISAGISARRKAGVILGSLAFFFGTVLWSGRKLLRAYKLK